MTDTVRRRPAPGAGDRRQDEIRYQTVLELSRQGADAVPQLLVALGDGSWRVRRAAATALAAQPASTSLLAALTARLAVADNPGMRSAAAEVLLGIGDVAVAALAAGLASADVDFRKVVVEVLGGIGTKAAVAALLRDIDDQDDNVRSAVVEALGRAGGGETIELLRARLRVGGVDLLQRVYLLDALGRLGARLPWAELSPWVEQAPLARALLPLLGASGDRRAAAVLIEYLERGATVSRQIAVVSFAALIDSLGAAERAAVVAEMVARPGRLPAVLKLLQSNDDKVVAAAARIAALFDDPGAAPKILEACAQGTTADAGLRAVLSLGPKVVAPLLAAIDAVDIEARVLFLEAVEILGDAGVVPTLLELAAGPETRATETAVRVVGSLGGVESIEALLGLAKSGDKEIRQAAVMALVAIGGRHLEIVAERLRRLVAGGEVLPGWITALGALGRDRDRELVIGAVHHGDPDVRQAAIEAALAYGRDFPEEILAFSLSDEQPRVRSSAARALAAFPTSSAARALFAATKDPDDFVVAEALRGLGRSSTPEAVGALREGALSSSSPIAIAAIHSLVRLNPPGLASVAARAVQHADPEVAHEAVELALRMSASEASEFLTGCLSHRFWVVRSAAAEALLTRRIRVPAARLEECLQREPEAMIRTALQRLLLVSEAGA
ncbi:MAG: HEAT repeat domain-containing protein [Deltaproteobacteria bacterium]|nr:HEAT repeat domain-containing protein [Deltaproteobacteria bacterium]